MSFSIRFWGVRDSIASPGPETARVGGNTRSVELAIGDTRILLDAGTGLRRLGDRLLAEASLEATVGCRCREGPALRCLTLRGPFNHIVGRSPAMQQVYRREA